MCLAVLFYHHFADAAVALAANREEAYDRPTLAPHWWDGTGPTFAGRDRRAGGTWLGVSRGGLLVAVTNRRRPPAEAGAEPAPRSRGLLCADALVLPAAAELARWLEEHLRHWAYEPFNLLVADRASAHVAHWDGALRLAAVTPGIHLLADTDLDDPDHARLRRARSLLARHLGNTWAVALQVLPRLMGDHADGVAATDQMCRHLGRGGTVSSSLVALPAPGPGAASYLYAPGPPCTHPYADLSVPFRAGLAGRS
ncbi:MAG: NRDE family protein [Gemmatimonadota bacterium]